MIRVVLCCLTLAVVALSQTALDAVDSQRARSAMAIEHSSGGAYNTVGR